MIQRNEYEGLSITKEKMCEMLLCATHPEIMDYYLECKNSFYGCYLVSNLPSFPKLLPATMLIKTINHELNHWSALILLKDKCFYFDSFAKKIDLKLLQFLSCQYKSLVFNVKRIQHSESECCGLFCLNFILSVYDQESFVMFLNAFSSKRKKHNERIALNHVFNLYYSNNRSKIKST